MGIKHTFVSAKLDGSDATVVRPTDWNSNHVIDSDVSFSGFGTTSFAFAENLSGTLKLNVSQGGLTLETTDAFGDYGHVFDVGSTSFPSLTIKSQTTGSGGTCLYLYQDSLSPDVSDRPGILDFLGNDAGGFVTEYAQIDSLITDITTGLEYGLLRLKAIIAGSVTTVLTLGSYDFSDVSTPHLGIRANSVYTTSSDPGNHSAYQHFTSYVHSQPTGSLGVAPDLGPVSADFGVGITVEKLNWTNTASAQSGEVDGMNIFVRQGGPIGGTPGSSDCSGILINAQNNGPIGGVSILEGLSSTLDANSHALLQLINVQIGPMSTMSGVSDGIQGYGIVLSAEAGASGAGVLIRNGGGTFTTGLLINGSVASAATAYIGMDGNAVFHQQTALPTGGTTGSGIRLSSTPNFGVFFGNGVPTLSAAKGSLYICDAGSGTTNRAYINTNGATGWTAIVTTA